MTHAGQVDDHEDGAVASCSCGWWYVRPTAAEAAVTLAAHYREHGVVRVTPPPADPMRGPGSPSALILRRLTRQALDRQRLRRWGS